ncbi:MULTISPECIES: ATP/GTP-binding protein [unclassified Saccharopolyspora]|uniref:AAA family ATPase n=1 Tax=unclassified Saccharopolyspora TaxID=2646250 RepID=UPI001CD72B0D|nr:MULTISPECIES: ATP-binding protein [unclassified Saccharopolyspora]MCA1186916.1 ATP-binding protein [Saccharopolyspora sp. 6T]MCA1193321.1 ATP-binding protein [Saccharopolyspora sp. 6V]MCA1228912.1 ATP-binding protein [Saccharopolyspora sp. 6M]MCA1281400.1 ATP-binding protein [Saccharopolyspora sp. 7B]
MLRSFRLGNHRSFAEEQELLLMPAYDRTREVLPVAAIYGANASGKSNLLDGLRFMRSAVVDSFGHWDADGDDGVPRRPFRLDPALRAEPSTFVVELLIESVRYTYGFVLDDSAVREEWLYSYPENRRRVLFEREGREVKFGSTVRTAKVKREVLEEMTRENALLLSVAGQSRFEEVQPVHRWFVRTLRFRRSAAGRPAMFGARRLAGFLERDDASREQVLNLIRAADLGIADVQVERREDRSLIDSYLGRAKRAEEAGESEEADRLKARIAELEARGLDVEMLLKFAHAEGGGELFELRDESQGTQQWVGLLPVVLSALHDGSALVVDEIDTSLHPLLTSRLIGLFRDERINTRQAQLILTTHDTSLLGTMLDEESLPRDSVWFVEKDRAGRSSLYALSDFKPRKGENHERRYLHGSYGAVPFTAAERFAEAFGVDR